VLTPGTASASLVGVLVVAGLAGCTSGPESPAAPSAAVRTLAAPDATEDVLFVARSDAGSLVVRAGARPMLELDGLDAVTWFSDRPARDAGTSSVTEALETFGWRTNGDPLGDDPPNATLVAAELGGDAVVVELLTATVDGDRVRFTVRFLGPPPASTDLSDIDVFIDDGAASPDLEVLPNGLERQASGGVVLGRTHDLAGQPHSLVLHLAPAVEGLEASVVTQSEFAAVVSGTTTYTVDGDVAIDDWRFSVDPTTTGDAAPIIVLKFTSRVALATLAKDPAGFSRLDALTDDSDATIARLSGLMGTVASRAGSENPDAAFYQRLQERLTDPTWTGVLIFDASVPQLPADIQGRSTAPWGNAGLDAFDIGFTVGPATGGTDATGSFFGTIDQPGAGPGDAYLRALFENGALNDVATGTD
jgi:hypothetical protein